MLRPSALEMRQERVAEAADPMAVLQRVDEAVHARGRPTPSSSMPPQIAQASAVEHAGSSRMLQHEGEANGARGKQAPSSSTGPRTARPDGELHHRDFLICAERGRTAGESATTMRVCAVAGSDIAMKLANESIGKQDTSMNANASAP